MAETGVFLAKQVATNMTGIDGYQGHRWGFDMQLDKSPSEAFSSSFFMILATEMGDETFIIAAVMAMRHPKMTVLGGALAALYIMTVLSAGLGVVLPNLISQKTVQGCATVLYTFFGCRLMYIGAKGEEENKDEEFEEVEQTLKDSASKAQKSYVRRMFSKFCTPIFLEALMLTFLAEWGDRSQIATITLAAHQNPIGVIIGACIGHSICTSLAVFGGEWLGKRISQRFVAFGGGLLFLVFAVLNAVYGIAGGEAAPEVLHGATGAGATAVAAGQ
jgi:putative Ca2+/H+ antiporter (TMEM165/GDT1 family)